MHAVRYNPPALPGRTECAACGPVLSDDGNAVGAQAVFLCIDTLMLLQSSALLLLPAYIKRGVYMVKAVTVVCETAASQGMLQSTARDNNNNNRRPAIRGSNRPLRIGRAAEIGRHGEVRVPLSC